jgi:acetylornithine deacetylase/succinyl-diaminopimelate desuccinylase-like protein
MLFALLLLAAPVDRDVLLTLLRVDTSHGHETDALKPVLERFKAAGVPAQILESGPGRGNLIARIKGTGAHKPLLLMAHIDVVPVEGQKWDGKPFEPVEKDGFLTARGVTDDKSMAAAIVAVALELASSPQKPSRDVIVALTAGEETGGQAGAQWLVKNHRDLIDAELALNEGGDIFLSSDLSRVEAVEMAVAEKTYKSFRLSTHGTGGHSSVPPTEGDPVLRLARALVRVGEHRFPAHVIPEARDMLAAAARGEKPPLSDALANSARTGKLTPADEKLITAERIYNAAIRTTCVVTQLEGAPADNVLPTSPWAAVNCRILPDETVDQTEAWLREAIGDPGVEIARMDDLGPGGKAPLVGPVPDAVHAAARKLWGDVPVVNAIQYGASDSRYLREAGIHSYGIDTAPTSLDEIRSGHSAHGANERAPVKWLPAGTEFLRLVVRELVK